MKPKDILYGQESRQKIKRGVDKVADAVKVTMGARGRLVVIDEGYGSPRVTKDGVTVAKAVFLKDRFESMGAELVKEASKKTNDLAGDGTTATCVLAQALYREAEKAIGSGQDPITVRNGIETTVKKAVEYLKEISVPVKDLEQLKRVGVISATDEEIGSLVAEVIYAVGADGIVAVEDSDKIAITQERVQGLQVDSGYISPYMVSIPERQEAYMEDAVVLVADKRIDLISDIKPLMDSLYAAGKKNLVIFAENVEGAALNFIVLNKIKGIFNTIAVRSPGFGTRRREILEDICAVTGAKLVSEELGRKLETTTLADCGSAKKVVATDRMSVVVEGAGTQADVDERCKLIEKQIELSEDEFDKNRHRDRKARILGGVGIFRVGAATESELKEKKQRVEDAICACKSALKEGIVAGGGVALLKVKQKLETLATDAGANAGTLVVLRSLEEPLKRIAENAGKNGEHVLAECLRLDQGYNVVSGKYEDMVASGVIDPTLVIRMALEHGASVANLLISTECVMVDEPEEKKS